MTHSTMNTRLMRVVCALLFLAFCFIYLYFYEGDVLLAAQHDWSDGATHYNVTIGAVLITLVLLLLQMGVMAITKLYKRTHALTYFPSLFLLLMTVGYGTKWHTTTIVIVLSVLAALVYVALVILFRRYQPYERPISSNGLFSQLVTINVAQMLLMFFIVCLLGNNHISLHHQMRMERFLSEKQYEKAAAVGKNNQDTPTLTMLRAHALARQGLLGDKLFSYAVYPSSDALIPSTSKTENSTLNLERIYATIGSRYNTKQNVVDLVSGLKKRKLNRAAADDYLLCAHLLDKQLDQFAKALPNAYTINDSLPKHYREALCLYTHLREHPAVAFQDSILEIDYEDFVKLQRKYPDATVRRNKLRATYRDSYWYYYYCR